jgi:hypothetical protein
MKDFAKNIGKHFQVLIDNKRFNNTNIIHFKKLTTSYLHIRIHVIELHLSEMNF